MSLSQDRTEQACLSIRPGLIITQVSMCDIQRGEVVSGHNSADHLIFQVIVARLAEWSVAKKTSSAPSAHQVWLSSDQQILAARLENRIRGESSSAKQNLPWKCRQLKAERFLGNRTTSAYGTGCTTASGNAISPGIPRSSTRLGSWKRCRVEVTRTAYEVSSRHKS